MSKAFTLVWFVIDYIKKKFESGVSKKIDKTASLLKASSDEPNENMWSSMKLEDVLMNYKLF